MLARPVVGAEQPQACEIVPPQSQISEGSFPNSETVVPGLDKNNVINIAQTRFQLAP
jgi:hypothetical protein